MSGVQCRVKVGVSNGEAEQEAERVAGHVIEGPADSLPAISRLDEHVARYATCAEEKMGDRPSGSASAPSESDERLETAAEHAVVTKDCGSPLREPVRRKLESRMGVNLAGVRVHESPAAQASANALNARAFTHRNDIWLGAGESPEDIDLLAHEATHVVQQDGDEDMVRRQPDDNQSRLEDNQSLPGDSLDEEPDRSWADDAVAGPDAAKPGTGVLLPAIDTSSSEDAQPPDVTSSIAAPEAVSSMADDGAPSGPGATRTGAGGPAAPNGSGGVSTAEEEPAIDIAIPPEPDTGAGDLETGDLVLIDIELAEHQRWSAALGRVGGVESLERAEFIADEAGSGFISGAASGLKMGLGMGLVTRVVPVIGSILGARMALEAFADRDWQETGATIGRFGEGSDTYLKLANSIESVATVIKVISEVLNVIGSIAGVVKIAAEVITAGSVVLAFFTFGATLAIAEVAADVALACEEISDAITVVTTILDGVRAGILEPCVLLFRALHEFTSKADPREVEAQGQEISSVAADAGSTLGGFIGGKAAHIGAKPHPPAEAEPPTPKTPHETPPPAVGDGPVVHFQEPPAPVENVTPRRVTDDQVAAAPAIAPIEPITATAVPAAPPASTPVTPPAPAPVPAAPATTPPAAASAGLPAAPTTVSPTGGKLKSITEPLELQGFGAAGPVPRGLDPGAIAHYGRAVANPHPFALESNPPGAPGATLTGGRMPPGGKTAGVFGEHQTAAALANEVFPGYQYDAHRGPDVKDALIIMMPNQAGKVKNPLDARDLVDFRARKAAKEDAPPVEAIVRGAANVKTATAGSNFPQEQISKNFLGEMDWYHERFGYQEVRPGEPLPPDHPLANASQAEIDAHLGRLFNPFEPVGTQLILGGIEGPRPRVVPREQLPPPTPDVQPMPNSNQTPIAFNTPPSSQITPGAPVPRYVSEGSTRSSTPLTDEQYNEGVEMAVEMGAPRDRIGRGAGNTSYFGGSMDFLRIGPDLDPLPIMERPQGLVNPANAALERHAVIGHEVIGHREAELGGATRDEEWHEELQASARAALHTPGLSREQSWLLLQDAAARRRFQTTEGEIYIDTQRYGPAAPKRLPNTGGGSRGPGEEPSVIIDYAGLGMTPGETTSSNAPPASAPFSSIAPESRVAPVGPAIPAPVATTAAAPAPPSIARGVGALFLPDFFGPGGKVPAYAEKPSPNQALFTPDNQTKEGVERVNPDYPEPPATPAQITSIQNEILNLLAVRSAAEQEAQRQSVRADRSEENKGPIQETVQATKTGISAAAAHDQAVAQRQAFNQEAQQKEQASQDKTGTYADRAAGLAVLTVPLAAWKGFTSLASHLPGDAGDKMQQMNQEAQELQADFLQMGAGVESADVAGPSREQGWRNDKSRLDATHVQAKTSSQQLETAQEGATDLQDSNEVAFVQASNAKDEATDRAQQCTEAVEEREEHAKSLAEQLQVWAQAHQAARQQAIAATAARLASEGKLLVPGPRQ